MVQDPYRMGYLGVWYLVQHLEGYDAASDGKKDVGTGEYLYSIFMPVGCLIVGYGVCLLFMPGIARAADQRDTTARCAWPGGPGEPSQTIGVLQRASMSYPNAPATRRRHRPSDRARSPGRWPAAPL